MELKTIFGFFMTLGMMFVIGSGALNLWLDFKTSDLDELKPSLVSNTILKAAVLLGIHMLAESYIDKSQTPSPMLIMSGFVFVAAIITVLLIDIKDDVKINKNLDKAVEQISNVTLDELRDKFKNVQSVRTKNINSELNKLVDKLSVIDNTDNVTIYKKAQSFTNKYLTILYVSVDNYAKLNNPDKKITNTILSTLKTVNAALDKIISESDELLQDDINSTAEAIKVLLEPAVSENPFEKVATE